MPEPPRPGQSPPPYLVQARSLLASGRPMDALRLLDGVLSRQPNTPPALRLSAEILLGLGAARPAKAAIDRFRSIAPDRVIGHLL
ncbi:MAG: tetratricopeptide repeat protein, partial [Planctomycetota bacterium]